MKSKRTVYLLIILVLIIWGLIVKKIFFSSDDTVSAIQPKQSAGIKSANKLSDTLLLNYQDPFLKTSRSKETPFNKIAARQQSALQPAANPAKPKPDILLQYVGYVIDKNKNATSYIIRINGNQQTMKQGDNINGLKLTKVTADSLFFTKDSDSYSVHIEQ